MFSLSFNDIISLLLVASRDRTIPLPHDSVQWCHVWFGFKHRTVASLLTSTHFLVEKRFMTQINSVYYTETHTFLLISILALRLLTPKFSILGC